MTTNTEQETDLSADVDGINPNDPRHGQLAFYNNHGCRCPACRRARRDAAREYRSRRAA